MKTQYSWKPEYGNKYDDDKWGWLIIIIIIIFACLLK